MWKEYNHFLEIMHIPLFISLKPKHKMHEQHQVKETSGASLNWYLLKNICSSMSGELRGSLAPCLHADVADGVIYCVHPEIVEKKI